MLREVAILVMRTRKVLLSAVGLAALAVAACGGGIDSGGNQPPAPPAPPPPAAANIKLASTQSLGNFLVAANGRTLYYFGLDLPASGGQPAVSNCTGPCLPVWPIFHADALNVDAGLSASDFGEITRADGSKQTTFKGWPLYFFAGDAKAGDTNGDNFEGWWVLRDPFYSVLNVTKDEAGVSQFLADPAGRTLYVFAHDTVGTAGAPPVSNCNGACVTNFPVFAAEGNVVPTGVDPAKLTSFTRADGTKQSAFDGHPLYYFSGDTAPGDTKGKGVNGVWDTLDPRSL
jgi:predicted lipoprotein with Yx(FWY)xxD motif